MPTSFSNKETYVQKLTELVKTEAQINKLMIESIAEKDVAFEFEEVLDIYCRLRLRVPKTNQQYINQQTILRVVIPLLNPKRGLASRFVNYTGIGTIKKVYLDANDPLLTVILQIDIMNPQDKRKR